MNAAAIIAAITTLRRTDRKRAVFGASTHRWQLAPPVTKGALASFERRYRVRLPDDYRDFLREVGNGGAGPHYGLYPLGVFCDISGLAASDVIGELAKPFPHRAAWNLADQPDPDDGERAHEAWRERYFDKQWIDGAIPICHEGCNHYDLLVVTGPERGRIWVDSRASDDGIRPVTSAAKRQTFHQWYVAWLTRALRECKARRIEL